MLTAAKSPIVIPAGQGDAWWIVGDRIQFKLTADQTGGAFTFAENGVDPGGGPPPHIHRREHEIFYILQGQLRLGLGDQAVTRGPGSAVFLPRDIVHTFKCVSATPAQFLLIAQPCGFERMVYSAGRPLASTVPGQAVGRDDITKLLGVCGDFGLEIRPEWQFNDVDSPAPADPAYWVLGHHITIKLSTEQTQGVLSLAEIRTPPGVAVPMHSHRELDEVFYVLEGTFRFIVNGQTIDAPPGTTLHVPPGTMHSFTNPGPGPARLIDYHLPGGFDAFFKECGTPAAPGDTTPPTDLPNPQRIMELLDRHGMDVPEG